MKIKVIDEILDDFGCAVANGAERYGDAHYMAKQDIKKLIAEKIIGRQKRKAQRAYLVGNDYVAVVEEKAQNELRKQQLKALDELMGDK